jgi:glycoprotein 3-alpha-L-fucosyltransferase
LHFTESPVHTLPIGCKDQFNWTATYRWDSDVVTPYEHWEYYDQNVKSQLQGSPSTPINYAANKTKKVREKSSKTIYKQFNNILFI